MSIESIGENAGRVWKVLHELGQVSLSSLKQNAELSDKDVYMSLGWLAREGKISFVSKGNQQLVGLSEV